MGGVGLTALPRGGEGYGVDVERAVGVGSGEVGDDERLCIGRREVVERVDDVPQKDVVIVGKLRVLAVQD